MSLDLCNRYGEARNRIFHRPSAEFTHFALGGKDLHCHPLPRVPVAEKEGEMGLSPLCKSLPICLPQEEEDEKLQLSALAGDK